MLSDNPYVLLYIKRILREVPFDSDHTYIAGEITGDLTEEIALLHEKKPELSIPALIKTLDDPSDVARRYRKKYGFTAKGLMLFNQTMIYASVAALYMVTAFVVFRLFPQREYVAYAVCAAAAVFGARIAFRQFFPVRHVVFSSFLPPFLLLFYPINDAFQASVRGHGRFSALFFSQGNRVSFVLTYLYLFLLLSLLGFYYIRLFRPVWPTKTVRRLTAALCAVAITGTGLLAAGGVFLERAFTREANAAASNLFAQVSAYSFETAAPAEAFISAAREFDRVAQTYMGILVPAHKQPALSAEAAVTALSLYAQGADELVAFYHASYVPKADRPLPESELTGLAAQLDLALRQSAEKGPAGLAGVVDSQRELSASLTAFRTGVRLVYENWIYEGTMFGESPPETAKP